MNDVNIALTRTFVNIYLKCKEEGSSYIPNTNVAKIILGEAYNEFTKHGEILPVEDLSEERKMELVAECKATGEAFTNDTLTNKCKILHVLKEISSGIL